MLISVGVGHSDCIGPETWDVLRRSSLLLKGPIATPQDGGYERLNVRLRKALGLFTNVHLRRTEHRYTVKGARAYSLVQGG